jgi:hypothetical protein
MIRQPAYRLMLKYNVKLDDFDRYFYYVTREFLPTLQELGIPMVFAWQVHGHYEERQLDFVCESRIILQQALTSERYLEAEERLKSFTTSYSRKIVRFENRFQF